MLKGNKKDMDRNSIIKTTIYALAIIMILSLLRNTEMLINIVLSIPGLMLAISVHEFSHAFTAYKLGDNTPKRER